MDCFTLYPQAYERNQGTDADITYMQVALHKSPMVIPYQSLYFCGCSWIKGKQIQEKFTAILEHRSIWDILEPVDIDYLVVYPEEPS